MPVRHPDDAVGPVTPVMLAISRAVFAPITPAEMDAESRWAYARVGREVGHPLACAAAGVAAFLAGDEDEALARFREGAATTLNRPVIEGSCLALIAVIEAARGNWDDATTSARRGRVLVGVDPGPTAALVVAVSILVETRAGRVSSTLTDQLLCRQQLTGLVGLAPWLNLQTRIALAHAALLRRDRSEAATLTAEAEQIARRMPATDTIRKQLAALRQAATIRTKTPGFGPRSLTTAELRVLQFLPTHLSNADIAQRLYVSPNTVKTQMISIYRKLGTNSRKGAVQVATSAGLLELQLATT